MNFLDSRLPARFWSKCIPEPNSGCWLWFGALTPRGYGQIQMTIAPRVHHRIFVHRFSFETFKHPIPDGLHIDHKCETTNCCNPLHLDAVTQEENNARYWARHPATHCRHGHSFAEVGRYESTSNGRVSRRCRACHSARMAIYYERRAEGA